MASGSKPSATRLLKALRRGWKSRAETGLSVWSFIVSTPSGREYDVHSQAPAPVQWPATTALYASDNRIARLGTKPTKCKPATEGSVAGSMKSCLTNFPAPFSAGGLPRRYQERAVGQEVPSAHEKHERLRGSVRRPVFSTGAFYRKRRPASLQHAGTVCRRASTPNAFRC
jgi:hypothetical protein